MMLPWRKPMACRSEQMVATKPVNYADQTKVKISEDFMQIQPSGGIPCLLPSLQDCD